MQELRDQVDKANSLSKKKEYEKAIEICNDIIKNHPEYLEALRKRATIYARMGKLEYAINDITDVIEKIPDEPSYYFSRGRWNLYACNNREAIKDFNSVLLLDKESGNYFSETTYFFRAVAYLRLGEKGKAQEDCEKVEDGFEVFIKPEGRVSKSGILKAVSSS